MPRFFWPTNKVLEKNCYEQCACISSLVYLLPVLGILPTLRKSLLCHHFEEAKTSDPDLRQEKNPE
jgi:hypothetical protein